MRLNHLKLMTLMFLLISFFLCASVSTGGNPGDRGSGRPAQGNTTTTRTSNPDGSTTVTTTTTYKDGSTTTSTTYDKDGHDAGTTRTDVQTKDGETTTTTTKYDGNGREIGKTITRASKDGTTTVITYDSQGHETGRTTSSKAQAGGQAVAAAQLVGVVYDKDSRPGEKVSVSLVTNPEDYVNIPSLGLLRVPLPADSNATARDTALEGLLVDAGDGRNQPASGPVTIQIPEGAASVPIRISRGNVPVAPAVQVPVAQSKTAPAVNNTGRASDFRTPPVCQNTSMISGPLSGDPQQTRITIDNQPARILTETPRAVHFDVAAGGNLVLQDGLRSAVFPIVRIRLIMNADRLQLLKGQSTNYSATVQLAPLPDSVWQHGGASPELNDLSSLSQLAPGFHVPHEGEPAVVLLRVENASRGVVLVKPSQNEVVTYVLKQQDFRNNQFTGSGVIQSERGGGFKLNGLAEAFFAPIPGQEISGRPSVAGPVNP